MTALCSNLQNGLVDSPTWQRIGPNPIGSRSVPLPSLAMAGNFARPQISLWDRTTSWQEEIMLCSQRRMLGRPVSEQLKTIFWDVPGVSGVQKYTFWRWILWNKAGFKSIPFGTSNSEIGTKLVEKRTFWDCKRCLEQSGPPCSLLDGTGRPPELQRCHLGKGSGTAPMWGRATHPDLPILGRLGSFCVLISSCT
jgi:hypothetical protein